MIFDTDLKGKKQTNYLPEKKEIGGNARKRCSKFGTVWHLVGGWWCLKHVWGMILVSLFLSKLEWS